MPSPSAPSSSFDQDSPEMGMDKDSEINFEFKGLEKAIGDVVITFFHKGDDSDGYYDLRVAGSMLGTSKSGKDELCTTSIETSTRVSEVDFNERYLEKEGDFLKLKLSMTYEVFGENSCATGSQIAKVNLKYQSGTRAPSTMPVSKPTVMPVSKPTPMPSPSVPSPCGPKLYDNSSFEMVVDENGEAHYEFTALEEAIGNAKITFFHKGDDSDGYYELRMAGGFFLGDSVSGAETACGTFVDSPQSVSAGDFNNNLKKDGDLFKLKLSMIYNGFGGNTCAAGSQIVYINLQYEYATCAPPSEPTSMPSTMPVSNPTSMPSTMPVSKPTPMPSPSAQFPCGPELYEQNSLEMVVDEDGEVHYELKALEEAIGNVKMTFFHKGDSSVGGYYELRMAGGFFLGDSISGAETACGTFVETAQIVSERDFNDNLKKDGDLFKLKLSMAYEGFGGNTCDAGTQIVYVNLEYLYDGCE
jgi:hypothetical protein